MPFSETVHGDRVVTSKAQWDHIYDAWIHRAIVAYKRIKLKCKRSSTVPGNFVRGIVSDLSEAMFVVADLTGNKANVFYELGIRHALHTGTILITQDIRSLPSDLRSYYAFEYGYSNKAHEYEPLYLCFEKELHEKIDAFIDGTITSDSPVSDYLGFRKEVYDRQLEIEKAQLKRLFIECGRSIEGNFHVAEFLLNAILKEEPIPLKKWPIIDIGPVEALYIKLLSVEFEMMGNKPVEQLLNIVANHRQALLMAKLHWDAFLLNPNPDSADGLVGMLEYFVETQKNVHNKVWPEVLSAVSQISVNLVVTEKNKMGRGLGTKKKKS